MSVTWVNWVGFPLIVQLLHIGHTLAHFCSFLRTSWCCILMNAIKAQILWTLTNLLWISTSWLFLGTAISILISNVVKALRAMSWRISLDWCCSVIVVAAWNQVVHASGFAALRPWFLTCHASSLLLWSQRVCLIWVVSEGIFVSTMTILIYNVLILVNYLSFVSLRQRLMINILNVLV